MENTGLSLTNKIETLLDELDRVGPPTGLDGAYTPEQTEQLTEIVQHLYESGVVLRHWFLGDVEEHDHIQEGDAVLSQEPVISLSEVETEPEESAEEPIEEVSEMETNDEEEEPDETVESLPEKIEVEETSLPEESDDSKETVEESLDNEESRPAEPEPEPAEEAEEPKVEIPEVSLPKAVSEPKPDDVSVNKLESEMKAFGVSDADDESVNERLSKQGETRRSVVSRIRRPISNLKTAIGINDRFLFINSLFQGNPSVYERALEELNYLTNLKEAERFVDFEFRERYKWDMEDPTVVNFMGYVQRRYL